MLIGTNPVPRRDSWKRVFLLVAKQPVSYAIGPQIFRRVPTIILGRNFTALKSGYLWMSFEDDRMHDL